MIIRRAFYFFAIVLLTADSLHAAASDVADAVMKGNKEDLRSLLHRKADVNAPQVDGTTALHWAVLANDLETADLLIRAGAKVSAANRKGAMPMQLATINGNAAMLDKLFDAGANPNALVNNTPRARLRDGSPRIVFATPLMRAAFSCDLELVKLLLAHGADPKIVSSDNETVLMAAAGTGFIPGYSKGRTPAERLEVINLLVGLGQDVNAADNYGITALMVAANFGDVPIIQYLIDQGADLAAHDLGKKNDGAFGPSIEPLMPVDYAIGVNEDAVKLMTRIMQEKGIKHTTSECTLRGFTCSIANVDPKTATPAQIALIRKIQIGYQVDGLTGGLGTKDPDKK